MNPSKVLAMWIHLGPDQLICVFITSETDCQVDFCYLAGVSPVHCSVAAGTWNLLKGSVKDLTTKNIHTLSVQAPRVSTPHQLEPLCMPQPRRHARAER